MVLTGRWKSEDIKLRPGMRTPNCDHLIKMGHEMPMRKMKMKMTGMMLMLLMMMMIERMRMRIEEPKNETDGKIKREIT